MCFLEVKFSKIRTNMASNYFEENQFFDDEIL